MISGVRPVGTMERRDQEVASEWELSKDAASWTQHCSPGVGCSQSPGVIPRKHLQLTSSPGFWGDTA